VHLAAPVDRLPTRVLQLDARRADCAQSRLPGGLSSQRLPGEVVHNCPQTYARRPANQTADASRAHHAVAQAIWCMTTACAQRIPGTPQSMFHACHAAMPVPAMAPTAAPAMALESVLCGRGSSSVRLGNDCYSITIAACNYVVTLLWPKGTVTSTSETRCRRPIPELNTLLTKATPGHGKQRGLNRRPVATAEDVGRCPAMVGGAWPGGRCGHGFTTRGVWFA
jgi:hypothetical protein